MRQAQKPYEGYFITIEGGEGCGKTTFAQNLGKELRTKGYELHLTREPGGTALAEKIRALLLDHQNDVKIGARAELLLFLAARTQHLEEVILPHLRSGSIVICERFNDSSIAYQGCARNLGMQEVENLCEQATAHFVPDFTFFLDLDPSVGLKRIQEKRKLPLDRLEKEALQFHKEVRQGFLHLADKYPNRICILDGLLDPKSLIQNAIKILETHLLLKPAKKHE